MYKESFLRAIELYKQRWAETHGSLEGLDTHTNIDCGIGAYFPQGSLDKGEYSYVILRFARMEANINGQVQVYFDSLDKVQPINFYYWISDVVTILENNKSVKKNLADYSMENVSVPVAPKPQVNMEQETKARILDNLLNRPTINFNK